MEADSYYINPVQITKNPLWRH